MHETLTSQRVLSIAKSSMQSRQSVGYSSSPYESTKSRLPYIVLNRATPTYKVVSAVNCPIVDGIVPVKLL
jgi:hypothetical protein